MLIIDIIIKFYKLNESEGDLNGELRSKKKN